MKLEKTRSDIEKEVGSLQPEEGKSYYEGAEWLETNGLGGWAGSSVIGCNTRRYHGLLVAAVKPPTERVVMLSKLEEAVIIQDARFELGTNLYRSQVIHPSGYQYIDRFTKSLFPEWVYALNGVQLKKTIAMVHGENTTVIVYEVLNAGPDAPKITLELLPLIAARGYHSLQHSGNNIFWDVVFEDGIFRNQPCATAPPVYISVPGSDYRHHPRWFYGFTYGVEKYRGLDAEEDLFNHGTISVELQKGHPLAIIVSTDSPGGKDGLELLGKEQQRRLHLIGHREEAVRCLTLTEQLTLAADQFIVKRDEELRTIIAGYHWFTDWGRDTMISLTGLCMASGRYGDAKKIIAAFSKNVSMGMLPNRFPDNAGAPEYNNVDGTLWYFIALYEYLNYTDDREFIVNDILPVLKYIIDWHFRGTRFNIHADEDGLLYAGENGQQLTWMDAKIGDWVVTPRMGKPVEIQALWYNALCIFSKLLELSGQAEDAKLVCLHTDKLKRNFLLKFWYPEGGYLYDVIDENGKPDDSIRPNQLFAISLPFPLIEGDQARSVLQVVEEKLYTPKGLLTLPRDDPRYVGVYGGDVVKRDTSYHQGTAWSWLLGAYVDAVMAVGKWDRGEELSVKAKCTDILIAFREHLNEACIGSVSEILDGDPPHLPRGCIAQAWSVAEILRVIKKYHLDREAP